MPMLEHDFDTVAGAIARSLTATSRNGHGMTATELRKARERCEALVLEVHDTLRATYPDTFQSSRFLRNCFAEADNA